MAYIFQSVEDTDKLTGSSKICNIINDFIDYDKEFPLVYGKIKSLFGKPIYETENMEELFSYCILTALENGDTVYLEIYCAGSGLAIGGRQNEVSKKAAKALVDYIRKAETMDYAHKAYYMDGPAVLEFGVNDGVPFYNEKELELSEKEFSELYAKLYGL